MRSPNWLEEEVMLALDLYVNRDASWINKMSDSTFEIVGLSKLLNGLDLHTDKPKKFRSTGSIRMKLANFMSLDDDYLGKSLGNVGILDKKVWEKYKNDRISLHEKCKTIINEHLFVHDDDLDKYINNMYLCDITIHVEKDFIKFAENLKKALLYYEQIAKKDTSNENAKKVDDSCKKIRKLLRWVKECDEVILLDDYKEHGGVNLKPIKNKNERILKEDLTEEKIGKLIRRTFLELVEQDKLSEKEISKLLECEYSHNQFGINHTFLLEIDEHHEIREQLLDANGYVRYWTKPICIRGKYYCICKEWYESQREKYLRWLSMVNVPPFYMLKAKQLKKILEYLKENDSKKTCIAKQDIINEFPIATIQEVINVLLDKGVLTSFQGSYREFVIDDYDIMFRMLNKPEEYAGE